MHVSSPYLHEQMLYATMWQNLLLSISFRKCGTCVDHAPSRHAAIHSHSCALCLTIVLDVEELLMPTIVGCPPRFAWQVCVPHGFPRSVEKRQTVAHKSIANCYSSPSKRAGNSCSRFARPFLACSTLYRTVCNVVLLKIKEMYNYQQK